MFDTILQRSHFTLRRLQWFIALPLSCLLILSSREASAVSATQFKSRDRIPNLLLVVTDDQRWDAMGVVQRERQARGEIARSPWLETPAMDRLAASGMRFRNSFVTLALCSPSRAALLTGTYNHTNGVTHNEQPFPIDSTSFASLLRKHGYSTAYFGKWHHGRQKARPGFDYSATFLGQGNYMPKNNKGEWDEKGSKDLLEFLINGVSVQRAGFVDDITAEETVKFISTQGDKPWLAMVGFKSPHEPAIPPKRRSQDFADAVLNPVPNLEITAPYNLPPEQEVEFPNYYSDTYIRRYYRTVAAADDALGQILSSLDKQGLTDDTVVVFTSDNGFFLGEHGLHDKRSAYEESMRVPLLFRYPRLTAAGSTSDALVLNIDVAPTFLDLAGIPVPSHMQGKSWRRLLEVRGEHEKFRKAFIYEYFDDPEYKYDKEKRSGIPPMLAVRTAHQKLVTYPDNAQWNELFRLKKDPYETNNVYQNMDEAELREDLEVLLEQLKKNSDF